MFFKLLSLPFSPSNTRQRKRTRANWSYLPSHIIDKIVTVVKETRRWRRDGPSLRSLNKYWCSQLNQHIVSIHPDKNRLLAWEDSVSLAKFPFLTSLHAEQFVPKLGRSILQIDRCLRPPSALDSLDHQVYHLPYLERMIGTLLEIPRLSQLGMSGKLLEECWLEGIWREMAGITSLVLQNSEARILNSGALALQKRQIGAVDCSALLDFIFCEFPGLKHLDINVKPFWIRSHHIPMLQALESVSLRSVQWLKPIASIQSIVSLSLSTLYVEDVERMASLSQLRSLTIPITGKDKLHDFSHSDVLSRLTELKMESVSSRRKIKDVFFRKLVHLRSLSLTLFRFSAAALAEHLTGLTKLELSMTGAKDDLSFLLHLSKLQSLSLVHRADRDHDLSYIASVVIPLPELRVLKLKPVGNRATVNAIKGFAKLEVLNISCCGTLPIQIFKELEHLTLLRNLSVSLDARRMSNPGNFLALPFLSRLEKLTICSEPRMYPAKRHLDNLRKKAPYLAIDIS